MEHVQAAQARIATIKGLVESTMPSGAGRSGAFRAALQSALGATTTDTNAPAVPAADAAETASLLSFGALGTFTPARTGGASVLQPPVQARISSRFGPRVHPVSGARHNHSGVDFAAPAGTPVRAAAAGTVTFAGQRGGYGNLVVVRHGDGTETWYAHQRDLGVRAGERVEVGAVLGTVGSTGRSTGPHLHLEVRRDGVPVDPLPLLGKAALPHPDHAHG